MRRRAFMVLVGGALASGIGFAQQPARMFRVAYLSSGSGGALPEFFLEGMRDRGYVRGVNLEFLHQHADGKVELLPEAARALVRANPDIIVTSINATTRAALEATRTIPIVMIVGTDVIREGFVASLARPGGSVTGLTWDVGVEVFRKRFEFLREVVPNASRVAGLWDSGQDAAGLLAEMEKGAAAIGARLIVLTYQDDLQALFETAVRSRAQALVTGGGGRMFARRKAIVELATKYGLPDVHYTSEFVDAGGLMSYAPNLPDLFRRGALYADRILRGANPADLPVEQPTHLELVVNARTARSRGLILPDSILLRADRVIE